MDRPEAISRLEALRAQTYSPETMPRLGVDFLEWSLSVLETFDDTFGPGSCAIPLNAYYRHRLADARELLSSLILELRRP